MTLLLTFVILLLLAVLTLVSHVEGIYTEMGKFLSREFQDNIEVYEQKVEPRLGVSRARASLAMAVLSHLSLTAIAVLIAYDLFYDGRWSLREIAQLAGTVVLIVIVFNRLLPFLLFTRTRGEWLLHWVWPLRVLIWLAMPVTVVLGFCLSVASLAEEHPPEAPEKPSEAVEALIEAGREEGILKESDRELIQSVVEFGDTTVREVMTPRPDVVAVPASTTVEQFIELQRTRPYSRVPVYEGTIDHVKGVVFAQDVLQVPDADARTRTVAQFMRPPRFAPETQRVQSLLRRMQRDNIHMVVVVDEYGSTAGVATIEDLVEEIVGEIRDEHEARADIVRETENSYVVPGNMDLDRLEELFGVRPESREAATVAGLVSELAGRIPSPGEVVEHDGLRFEVLNSTHWKVERLRISRHGPEPQRLPA